MSPTLQAILKRRQSEEFFGRAEQVAFFQENLGYPPEDPRRRFLYHIPVGNQEEAERFYRQAAGSAPPPFLQEAMSDLDDFLALSPGHPLAEKMRCLLQEQIAPAEKYAGP